MNIVITLPRSLWEKIKSGEKTVELRKSVPRLFDNATSKCFVVLKGTSEIVGYFKISQFTSCPLEHIDVNKMAKIAGIPPLWFRTYYTTSQVAHIWHISEVYEYPSSSINLSRLWVTRNPQSYVYTINDLLFKARKVSR